jgi:tRNA (cmo5U34)-methyltransferase
VSSLVNTDDPRGDAFWQRPEIAEQYLTQTRQVIPLASEQLDVVRRLLDAHGVTVHTLLDVGAGDGFAAAAMMERHPVELAVLLDFSETMLAAAAKRFAESPVRIEIISGDLQATDWHDAVRTHGPFDAIVSRYAIHHIPHDRKRALYADLLGFLRPGGVFINIEHVSSASAVYEQAWAQLFTECISETYAGEHSRSEAIEAYWARQDVATNILAPVEDQCAWLREAGYVDIDCPFKLFELAIFAGRKPDAAEASLSDMEA